jgi:glycosyltransferase involved in cell wall biosynthesis
MKNSILFIYRNNVLKQMLEKDGKISGPTEFLYGMNLLDKKKNDVNFIIAPRGTRKTLIEKICYQFEKHFNKATLLGLPIDIFPLFKKEIKKADKIICINDAISFGLLFWKMLGFIEGDVYALMQSLPERAKYFKNNKQVFWLIKKMLSHAEMVLTLSDYVQPKIHKDFDVPMSKMKTFYFGVDTKYWKKTNTKKGDFILTVGNDMNRDYKTLIKALPKDLKLKIVTRNNYGFDNNNVEILQNISDEDLRKLYNQALFVVIPSIKLKYESSGMSTCLQTLACGTVLLASHAPTLEEVFKDKTDCLYYKAEDVKDLNTQIKLLIKNVELRKKLEKNGYKKAQKMSSKIMKQFLEKWL